MEIVTYGNVQLLAGILQGVVYIFGGDDYRAMMVVVGAIGFIVALISYAFQPQKLVGWYWLATVLCVSTALVLPRTSVQLIDRLPCSSGSCVTVVNNVPYGLAAVASVTSRIGDKLAELFETTFGTVTYSIPEGSEVLSGFPHLTYRNNGLMFGSKIVRETARVTFPDANFRYNLVKYLDNCAGPDMSDGTVDANDVRNSPDIWDTLSIGGNPARFTPTAGGVVMSCAALRTQLDTGMAAEITAATNMLGRRLNADAMADGNALSAAGAQARVGDQVSQAYLRARLVGDAAGAASQMVRQSAMINAMGDAAGLRSQRTNDPTSMMVGMAEAQAKVSTNTSWITGAKVAEEAMPLIRNGIEAILYASFPIIVLMMLVVTGRTAVKLLTSYASTLLWIQLWPVLFAVLNYMATAAASRHLAAAGAMPNGTTGLSLLTAASIYENSISDVAVVGYLVISIPVIAWSLVKGMEAIGAGALAGASAFTGGAHVGATQAATGNISMGVARTDDVRMAPHYGSANYSTSENGFSKSTDDFSSRNLDTGSVKKSDMGIDASFVHRAAEAKSLSSRNEAEVGQSERTQSDRLLSSTISQGLSLAHANSRIGTQTEGVGQSESTTNGVQNRLRDGTMATDSHGDTTSDQDSKRAGVAGTSTTDITKGVTATAGGSVGFSSPFGGVKAGVETSIAGRESEGATKTNTDEQAMTSAEIASRLEQAQKSATSDEMRGHMHSLTQDSRFQMAVASGDTAARTIQSGYTDSENLRKSSESHFQESQRLSSEARHSHENAESIAVNLNQYAYHQIDDRGQYASDLHHSPDRAAQTMSEATSPAFRSMGNQPFAAGYGQQSEPVADRLNDGRVESMREDARTQAPTPSAVEASRAANDERVLDEAHGVRLHPEAGGGGGTGPGRAPYVREQMAQQAEQVESQRNNIVDGAREVADDTREELDRTTQTTTATKNLPIPGSQSRP